MTLYYHPKTVTFFSFFPHIIGKVIMAVQFEVFAVVLDMTFEHLRNYYVMNKSRKCLFLYLPSLFLFFPFYLKLFPCLHS